MKTTDLSLLSQFQSERDSVQERMAAGKELRKKYPRILHGDYKPASDRADPVAILIKQGKTRLRELAPVRYARMLTSPSIVHCVAGHWRSPMQNLAILQ